jgi:hypothetical protein
MMTPWKVTRVDAALLTVAAPVNLLIALVTLAVLTGPLIPFVCPDNVAGMAAVIGFIEAVIGVLTVTLPRS